MAFGISAGAWLVAGATVGGALIAHDSAGKAVDAQTDASNKADASARAAQESSQAFQQKQLDQARIDNQPWRDQGAAALNKLAAAPDFTGASVGTDPGYQFGLNEGMKGLTNSAAARGGLLSGAALKASTKYAQDYAGTKFNDAFTRDTTNKNRLASLAGIGQTAAGQTSQAGLITGQNVGQGMMQTGQSIAQNALGVGNARASGYLANGNALTGAINQGVSAWNQYQNKPAGFGDIGSSGSYSANDYLTS